MEISKVKHHWLKTLTPLALGLGAILVMDLPAIASPQTFEIAQVRSRAIAPTPLNITPPSGTHIPLPQTNSNYYYHNRDRRRSNRYYRDCDRDYYNHRSRRSRRRSKKGGITVIIDTPTHYGFPTSGNYIRVVR